MDKKDIIQKLKNGEMKLYEVDKYSSSTEQAIDIRREFIEETTNTKLNTIANYTLDMESASKKNIENPIGTIQIPIGVAGPLRINGEYIENDDFYVPLATSEGALVASVNRGCSTITEAGGVNSRVIDDKMTRAPVIKAKSGFKDIEIKKWFEDNFQNLKKIAESTTKH